MPSAFVGNNSGTGQKFGCALSVGYFSYHTDDPNRRLELAVGAKRAKENENGTRSGAVFMYANDDGLLVPGGKNSLEDVGESAQAGALFGSSLGQ